MKFVSVVSHTKLRHWIHLINWTDLTWQFIFSKVENLVNSLLVIDLEYSFQNFVASIY